MKELLINLWEILKFVAWMIWQLYNFDHPLLSIFSWAGTAGAIITFIKKHT